MADSDGPEHDPSKVPADERSSVKNKYNDIAVGEHIAVNSGTLIDDNVIITEIAWVRAKRALDVAHTRL